MKKINRLMALIMCLLLILSAACVWAEEAVEAAVETVAEETVEETVEEAPEAAEEVPEEAPEEAPVLCPCCNEEIELNEAGENPHVLPCSIIAPVDEEGNKTAEDSIHYSCDGKEHSEEINEFCIDKHFLCQSEYMHTCVVCVEENGAEKDLGCGDMYPCHESDEHAICRVCGEPWCLNGNAHHRAVCDNKSHRPCAEGYQKAEHALCECGEAHACTQGHKNGECAVVVAVVEEEVLPEKPAGDSNACPNRPDCEGEMQACGIHCEWHSCGLNGVLCGGCPGCGDENACQGDYEDHIGPCHDVTHCPLTPGYVLEDHAPCYCGDFCVLTPGHSADKNCGFIPV